MLAPDARDRRGWPRVLIASIPFIVNGRIGILGVGLVNDDMANHLLIADWLKTRVGEMPALIHQGYPVGPHALVAGLSEGLGVGLIEAFAGLTLAIPALTRAGRLRGPRAGFAGSHASFAAALVALPYLAAAYLAQEAFKEPIEALFVLSLRAAPPDRDDRPPRDPARRDRRRLRLRVQLPGPLLAGGDGGDLVAHLGSGAGAGESRVRDCGATAGHPPQRPLPRPSRRPPSSSRSSCSPRRTSAGSSTSPTSAPSSRRRSAAASATCATSSRRSRRSGSGRRATSASRRPTRAARPPPSTSAP